jgi:O-antigen/teichoic acid export membrane protein
METPESDRIELIKGALPSLVINLGFLLIAKGDQRMILLLIFSTVIGLVMLLTPRGALGFGIILGAIAAAVIALALAGFAHWSPLS